MKLRNADGGLRIEKLKRLTRLFLSSNPHSAIRIPQSKGLL
jgi:hypothetical protein